MSVAQRGPGPSTRTRSRGAWISPALWVGRFVGAGLLVWMGWIHLHLWSEGYKHIATIGPLFMANFVVAIILALAVLLMPSRLLVAAASLAGAGSAIGTLGGLLVSINFGLFGFTDSWNAPFAHLSLAVEIAASVVTLATASGAFLSWTTGRKVQAPAQGLAPDTLRKSSPTTGL